jgi:hypothetical protein
MAGKELLELVINKVASVELKTDYHSIIVLALMQDLAKCTFRLI